MLDYNVSYEKQVSTDDVNYSYRVVLSIKDENGKESVREVYLYEDTSEEDKNRGIE